MLKCICIFCLCVLYGVWVAITFLSSQLVCYALLCISMYVVLEWGPVRFISENTTVVGTRLDYCSVASTSTTRRCVVVTTLSVCRVHVSVGGREGGREGEEEDDK